MDDAERAYEEYMGRPEIGFYKPFEKGDIAELNTSQPGLGDLLDYIPSGTRVVVISVEPWGTTDGFQTFEEDIIWFEYTKNGKTFQDQMYAHELTFIERPEVINDPSLYAFDLFEWGALERISQSA